MHFISQVSCLEMLGTCPAVGIRKYPKRWVDPCTYLMEGRPRYIFCGGYTQVHILLWVYAGTYSVVGIHRYLFCGGYTQVHILWWVYTGTYSQEFTVRVRNSHMVSSPARP